MDQLAYRNWSFSLVHASGTVDGMNVSVFSVFGGEGAGGNATGVVVLARQPHPSAAQEFAARLGVSDTVFLWQNGPRWNARFFSPFEELAVCYQALLAGAEAVGAPRSEFICGHDASPCALLVEREAGQWWVRTPATAVKRRGSLKTPFGLGEVIDTGRTRVYLRVDSVGFETMQWSAADALAWLTAQSLSGLCLVDAATPTRPRLRVFTTSLRGAEDIATGGAVVALPEFLGVSMRLDVEQGQGAPSHRGRLVVQGSGPLRSVSGQVVPMVDGTSTLRLDSALRSLPV